MQITIKQISKYSHSSFQITLRDFELLFLFGTTLSLLLVLWSVGHVIFAAYFAKGVVARGIREPQNSGNEFTPPVSIIISLRGYDPSLGENLIGLLNQDYPNYEIVIVIDHREDAAWHVVESISAQSKNADRLKFMELNNPLDSCSLKCNSLIQAYSTIDSKSEVLVLVDADVVPHTSWLRDVVGPLSDLTIGVSTGNQWYCPKEHSVGSLVRSLWNSVAIVPTAVFANPWAGTCAIRVDDVERTGLIEIWKNSAVDDGPIRRAFEPLGLKVHFEPRLIMVNSDACTLRYVNQYVTRMLTWSRMYESSFLTTIVHMLIAQGLTAAVLVSLIVAIPFANWLLVTMLGAALIIWTLVMLTAFCVVRSGVKKAVSTRGEKLEALTVSKLVRLAALVPVCHFLHAFWTIKAMFSTSVSWREVTYRLKGQNEIEMIRYQRYSSETEKAPSRVSI